MPGKYIQESDVEFAVRRLKYFWLPGFLITREPFFQHYTHKATDKVKSIFTLPQAKSKTREEGEPIQHYHPLYTTAPVLNPAFYRLPEPAPFVPKPLGSTIVDKSIDLVKFKEAALMNYCPYEVEDDSDNIGSTPALSRTLSGIDSLDSSVILTPDEPASDPQSQAQVQLVYHVRRIFRELDQDSCECVKCENHRNPGVTPSCQVVDDIYRDYSKGTTEVYKPIDRATVDPYKKAAKGEVDETSMIAWL